MAPPDVGTDDHILTLILDRLSHIETRMDSDKADASESRRRVHEKLEHQGSMLITIEHRVAAVEKSVDSAAQTLREYGEMKAKVAGGGILALKLWKFGVWLIGAAALLYGLRHDIAAWWHWLTR